jgi:hypothetical protein
MTHYEKCAKLVSIGIYPLGWTADMVDKKIDELGFNDPRKRVHSLIKYARECMVEACDIMETLEKEEGV